MINVKVIVLFFIVLLNVNYSYAFEVGDNQCHSSKSFFLNFPETSLGEIEQNFPGWVIPGDQSWNVASNYSSTCDCTVGGKQRMYFTSSVEGKSFYKTIDGWNYYNINEYLAVATRVYIFGQGKINVPFTTKPNASSSGACVLHPTFSSGGAGLARFVITKRVVGEIEVNNINLFKLYAQQYPTAGFIDFSKPISSVNASIKITSPLGCTFDVGSAFGVDFGEISTSSFESKYNPPTGVGAKPFNIEFTCTTVLPSDIISAHLRMNSDPTLPYYATTNLDGVGVVVLGTDGYVVQADSALDVQFDVDTEKGSISLSVYPTRTKDKMEAGEMNAMLVIEMGVN